MRGVWVGFKLVAGAVVGLVLSELAFRARSGATFPHLNFYETDSELGLRLAPHAEMSLAFSGNPATHVATNALGFRGAEWPAPSPGANREVLVVGDSQVFGLGVEHSQTFASQLEEALHDGSRVLNAGVPTYGPIEYTALVERLVARRRPARVVYVLNLANDLFELERPNRERHVVWDGWAVRAETAPRSKWEFPGRRWLMSKSHAVFALRSWLRGLDAEDAQFPSEGGFQDIVARASGVTPPTAPVDVEQTSSARARIAAALAQTDGALLREFALSTVRDKRYVAAMRSFGQLEGDPRDIVQPYTTESARPVHATAFHLLFAALALDKNAEALQQLARSSGNSALLAHVERRRALRAELARTASDAVADAPRDPLEALLARTQRACDAAQAELMVVILPLDVQVSPQEWQKYGQSAIDMSATTALSLHVAERARRLGTRVVDATPVLRATEPGAFLDGDLHMSPRGHAALAAALAAAWRDPLPPPPTLPFGRSALPAADEWRAVEPHQVAAESADGCSVSHVREWWRVWCRPSTSPTRSEVTSISLLRGGRGDAIADLGAADPTAVVLDAEVLERSERYPQLIAPVLEGDVFEVQLGWSQRTDAVLRHDHARTLRIEFRQGGEPLPTWGPVSAPAAIAEVQPKELAAIINRLPIPYDLRCQQRRSQGYHRAMEAHDYDALGPAIEALRTDPQRCQLGKPMRCDLGEIAFGVTGHCVPACAHDQPCQQGSCSADRGRFGCITP